MLCYIVTADVKHGVVLYIKFFTEVLLYEFIRMRFVCTKGINARETKNDSILWFYFRYMYVYCFLNDYAVF